MTPERPRGGYVTPYGGGPGGGREGANLGDILERVLDKGIVIAGDIQVNLLDIELLTIKLRLLVVSVETARELGIDWWEHDPWLTGDRRGLEEENRRLRERVEDLEEGRHGRRAVDAPRPEPAEPRAESRPGRERDPERGRDRGRIEEPERRHADPERRRD
ncbi:gas vesicle protein [Actinoallomurus spadix]|uniref:Gas vesicle structural protein n=1 Tax=Actinoallomurus spadix TaxID=79912 RepID=A0ABN0WPW1_9ACTN|nr:gas vesicle protein [Actinoallomurus spadix]MCO5984742.1 gas vesicle protein [Actinoallomurus spadix]